MGVQTHLAKHQVIYSVTRKSAQHISTKGLLYHTVSLLTLPIHYRIVSSGIQQFGTQPSEQLLPEVTHEVGVPVSNNLARMPY